MGFNPFKKARKFVKKIIPKEIRPFIPYIAAAMGPASLATSGIFSNPAITKALLAGGTKFATDDEADLKDIGITAALAAAPTALDQFAGPTGPDTKGLMGTLRKGSRALAQKAKDSPYLTMGTQAGVDVGIKQAELNQQAIDDYNASLLSQGMQNKGDRRTAIFNIFKKSFLKTIPRYGLQGFIALQTSYNFTERISTKSSGIYSVGVFNARQKVFRFFVKYRTVLFKKTGRHVCHVLPPFFKLNFWIIHVQKYLKLIINHFFQVSVSYSYRLVHIRILHLVGDLRANSIKLIF